MPLFSLLRYSGEMKNFLNALLIWFTAATVVSANPPGWTAFTKGDFETARTIGRRDGGAEGLAHACRAGLVLGGFSETGPTAIKSLHGAIADCNKTLLLQPDHFFAKMSLAIALSFEGKRLKRPSYPLRAKAYILELIEQEPENPLGYGALAAWHSEVSAAGFFARIALGARRNKAEKNFATALKLGAIDYALKFEYVKFLARGNQSARKRALIKARILLQENTVMAFDQILRKHCIVLARALERNNKPAIKKALIQATAFQGASPERVVERFPLEALAPTGSN